MSDDNVPLVYKAKALCSVIRKLLVPKLITLGLQKARETRSISLSNHGEILLSLRTVLSTLGSEFSKLVSCLVLA